MNFFKDFALTDSEWKNLEDRYDRFLAFQSWQLLKMNTRNNHTDEFEDIRQEQSIAMYHAACYYKRQVYIQECFSVVKDYLGDPVVASVLHELEDLWNNKTRHGAGKVKYGDHQQQLLDRIVASYVPAAEMPDKKKQLRVDPTFVTYLKATTWNSKKNLGRKITKEKSWRSGLVSLSSYDYLQAASA